MNSLVESSETPPLGRSFAPITEESIGGMFEITLNYPRTTAFVNAIATKQKRMYSDWWRKGIAILGIENIKHSGMMFEYCKTGHIHLHGYVFLDEVKIYPVGGIADLSKTFLSFLTKKYRKYCDHNLYPEYGRYRSPAVVVQYRYKSETARAREWLDYITKNQLDKRALAQEIFCGDIIYNNAKRNFEEGRSQDVEETRKKDEKNSHKGTSPP